MVVLAAVSMVALFGFAALSIDLAHVYQQQRDMQSATDAAALAGALFLTNSPQNSASIIEEATITAQANGLGSTEVGTIEVGQWDTNSPTPTFVAGVAPYNAVRVPAQRSVPLTFGAVVGMNQMTPVVHSVAVLQAAGSASGGPGIQYPLIPMAILQSAATNAFYTTNSIIKADVGTTGNYGPLDFRTGASNNGKMDQIWEDNMTIGCNCTYSIGSDAAVNTSTGNDVIYNAFYTRLYTDNEPDAVIAVVAAWPTGGSTDVPIVGFVGVHILSVSGNKGNWTVTYEVVPVVLGGGGGGGSSTNAPYALARVLVQ
jgi:Flp pilus assembly protein TadG